MTESNYLESNYPTLAVTLMNDYDGFVLLRKKDSTDKFYLIAAEDDHYRAPLSKNDILALGIELIQLVGDEQALKDLEEW